MRYRVKAVETSDDDILRQYSDPELAQKNAFKYLGPDAILYKSNNKHKKYAIRNPTNGTLVNFGSMKPPMEDYLKHKDETRQLNYLRRAIYIKGDWSRNKYSPNMLSIFILWQ